MRVETLIDQSSEIQAVIRQAGKIAIKKRGVARWHRKSKKDLVSDVDIQIERFLYSELCNLFGSQGYFGEETSDGCDNRSSFEGWIVDPLDGTINYYHGIPFYAISVAFSMQNRIEAGFVYDPTKDEMFWAFRKHGAYMNDSRIHVSNNANILHSLGAMASAGLPVRNVNGLFRLADDSQSFRRLGSTALWLAYVAIGKLDYFISLGTKIWDVVAGTLLIEEAEGVTSGKGGFEMGGNQYDLAAASNELFAKIIHYL